MNAPASAVQFPEVNLNPENAAAPTTGYFKAVLTINSKQGGQPWCDQVTTYHHCTAAIVSVITGQIAGLGSMFGPRGNKPQNAQFDLAMKLEVEGQAAPVASGEWTGVSREFILAAERGLLEMWLGMNEQGTKAAKAHGKI